MVRYEKGVVKRLSKGRPSKSVFISFNNAFRSIELTGDLTLFNIKLLKDSGSRKSYRLRKGKYRALFYIENGDIYVFKLEKREDVYRK